MSWIEDTLATAFNEERDHVAKLLTDKIKQASGQEVRDMEFGNWTHVTVKPGPDFEEDSVIVISSTTGDDGNVTLTMRSQENIFEGDITVSLDELTRESFNSTMILGQTWDIYNHIKSNPLPDLNEHYDPYKLPPLPTDKRL